MLSSSVRRTLLLATRPIPIAPSQSATSLAFLSTRSSKSKKQATIAERPPAVPDSISDVRTEPITMATGGDGTVFQPIVNVMRTEVEKDEVNKEQVKEKVEEEYVIPDTPDLSKLPSLDINPMLPPTNEIEAPSSSSSEGSSSSSDKTKAKSSKKSMSSIERQRRNYLRAALIGLTGAGVYGAWYLGTKAEPVVRKDGVTVTDEDANPVSSYFKRFRANFTDLLDYFNKPAFDKLLPDSLPPPHQRPYTLLVDLEDFLVHSSWDRTNGWRTAKRPGVDYFLAYLSQFYEIVLFTSQPSYTSMGVVDKLDPFQAYLPYRLYRESTRHVDGKVVKDLSYLNRDLSKVILLDTNSEHGALQPENTVIIPKWDGKAGDKGLVDYIPFLESIGIFAPPDVRPILKAYESKNIPVEYAKREAERKAAAIADWEREHGPANASSSGGGGGFFSSMFGGLGGNSAPRQTQPTTYLEAKRAQAQKLYLEEQEYWKKNADEIKRLMEEDIQKQMAAQKGTLMGWMSGARPAEGSA